MESTVGDKMKKSDLKQLIKPLVKECIHEVLLEEGLLSNVVAEVAKGLQGATLIEAQQPTLPFPKKADIGRKTNESREKLQRHRQDLMKTIGNEAYNGVNLFENTTAMPASTDNDSGGPASVLGENTADPGVDISSIIGGAAQVWQAMK